MTICDWSDRIEVVDGKVCRIVTATSRKTKKRKERRSFDVFREWEDGSCECRNLYTSFYGLRVGFPGDVNSYYSHGEKAFVEQEEEYGECRKIKFSCSDVLTDASRNAIESVYPDFKWTLSKWSGTNDEVLRALAIWKEHKDAEFVLAAGFTNVALNKTFWRLTESNRKELSRFMRANRSCGCFSLQDIQTVLKRKIKPLDYKAYKMFCGQVRTISFEIWKYLQKIGMANYEGYWLYHDYKVLLGRTTHDANDDYWKWPKDLRKKHDELSEELRHLDEVREAKELAKKQKRYFNAVKKKLRWDFNIDGYRVYVPSEVNDIKAHADTLHQCLISADYVTQVIEKKCLLVFVQKDGVPIATAQILSRNKIGQFYANELDRSNCLPTDEVRAVVNKWIKMKRRAA